MFGRVHQSIMVIIPTCLAGNESGTCMDRLLAYRVLGTPVAMSFELV